MPTFAFTARDLGGRSQTGTLVADSSSALNRELRTRGLTVVDFKVSDAGGAAGARGEGRRYPFGPGLLLPATGFDVELGMRQLATMLQGGLSLVTAIKTCGDQARRPAMAKVWDQIHRAVLGGTTVSAAMAQHPRLFPKLVIQLVKAGEQTGQMERVLELAAEQLERRRELMATLVSALMYPAFAVIIAVGVTAFLLVKVIPDIAGFIANEGKKLPAMTAALISVSNWVVAYLPGIAIGLATTAAVLFVLHRNPKTGLMLDRALLVIPIAGKLIRMAGTAMFARGLGMLLDSGVPLLEALVTSGGLMKNRAMSERARITRDSVLGGGSLAKPLGAGSEFLPMLPRMVSVGEQTGSLGSVLERVAEFHEKELHAAVKRMAVMIEPVMTVVVGCIVGFVYLAFFMAIYSFAGN